MKPCPFCGKLTTYYLVGPFKCKFCHLLIRGPQDGFQASAAPERDPDGLDAKSPGSKLDAGKAPVRRGLLEYFPRACLAVAEISAAGAAKYTWNGWETVSDGVNRYGDAGARHVCMAAIQGAIDPDFNKLHAAHEAWDALARLELILRERESFSVPAPATTVEGEVNVQIEPDPRGYAHKEVHIQVTEGAAPVVVTWGDPGASGDDMDYAVRTGRMRPIP